MSAELSPDQLRLEVLKAMGWKRNCDGWWVPPSGKLYDSIASPPPLTLDLMWQAEGILSADECLLYERILVKEFDGVKFSDGPKSWMWHATKEQRARAFLKVKGSA